MSVHDELVKLQEKWQRMGSKSEGIPARSHTLTECADGLAPIIGSAAERERELAALKDPMECGHPVGFACKLTVPADAHSITETYCTLCADLREVAEMAAEKWAESEEIGFEPSEEQKKWFVDSILREFREKKAEVGK